MKDIIIMSGVKEHYMEMSLSDCRCHPGEEERIGETVQCIQTAGKEISS